MQEAAAVQFSGITLIELDITLTKSWYNLGITMEIGALGLVWDNSCDHPGTGSMN